MEKDCIFCKIVNNEIPSTRIYEDEFVISFLDIRPINKGHVLIVPKGHYEIITDMPEDIALKVFSVALKIEKAIRATEIPCEGTNLFQNNGRAAGQEVDHVHFHVVPRFKGDAFKSRYTPVSLEMEEFAEVAEQIRGAMEG
ncbi:MAG: HIT family protein [Bacteroidetes bacterium]|nr:HIT family protein [Bacteroidota bacterium]